MFDIARLRNTRTRSISPENPTGTAGQGGLATTGTGVHAARELGQGWKMSPSVIIRSGTSYDLAAIEGRGRITHIWMTTHQDHWRSLLLRAFWDGAEEPAIEVPFGDFFCNGWGAFAPVSSTMVAANPSGGFNSYWPMPFRTSARLSLENTSKVDAYVYFQVTYEEGTANEGAADEGEAYLHAQWRRSNPLAEGETHVLVDGVEGAGHYVGTYLAWEARSNGWWGEGEVKFYLDDDVDAPTICGTGTEDYFGGAWNFDVPGQGYVTYSTPYLGMPQVVRPDGLYRSQQRFGMYRWHVPDPISFSSRLVKVDVQALGWRSGWRYLQLRDDIASTALFYLDRPVANRPVAPTADAMEIITGDAPAPDLGLTPPRMPPQG